MLKICPYRQSRGSKLECTITEQQGKNSTSSTSISICNECSIPEIIQQVNCKNLNLVKFHLGIFTQTYNAIPEEFISESGWRTYCQIIDFNRPDDYKTKCSHNCPGFQPINRDLSSEELILIPNFNAAKATDRELRQAVLLILYKYHTRYPERYHCFDVTLEFIAKSLNINVGDVVRVIFPMEDEQEVITEQYLGEPNFGRVRITSRGIKMIDKEPLFDRLTTAEVRVMETLINMPNSQVSALSIGNNNQNQGEFMSENYQSKYDQKNSNNQFLDTAQPGSNQTFNQNNYTHEQRQNLVEAAKEIEEILQHLQQNYPTITTHEKISVVAKAVDEIEKNHTLKARVIGALKAGGIEALKELVDNPLINILLASIEGWQEAE